MDLQLAACADRPAKTLFPTRRSRAKPYDASAAFATLTHAFIARPDRQTDHAAALDPHLPLNLQVERLPYAGCRTASS